MEFRPLTAKDGPAEPCALQQSQGYARALLKMGADAMAFAVMDGATPCAHVVILRRRFGPLRLCWVPRGPVWAADITPRQRARVLAALPTAVPHKALWLLSPDRSEDLHAIPHTALMTPQHVGELDLTPPKDTRLAAQHGKWRNRLRHAQSAGLDVTHRPFDPIRDHALLSHEARQRSERRYSALPPEFTLAWATENPDQSRLFTASRGGETVAQMLILLHAPVATYHIGWSGPEGRQHSAHNLLLWETSNWLAAKGYLRLDLGCVDTDNSPGLARFKIGSGAQIRALGPTCLRLPRLLPVWRTRANAP